MILRGLYQYSIQIIMPILQVSPLEVKILYNYSPVRNRRPLDYLLFQKMHTRTFLLQPQPPPPAYKFFEPRGHCPHQTQNYQVKVIHGQTFCPLFVVLKIICMIKSQFPHHLLSYVRSEWNKLPQKQLKICNVPTPFPTYCNPSHINFQTSNPPVYCHPLLFRSGEYYKN